MSALSFVLPVALPVLAYLFGSVSAAVVVCRAFKLPDPRTLGSGNPGATNVLRFGGKTAAAATLAGDFVKGLAPVAIAAALEADAAIVAATGGAAFLGHLYPLFFRLQGGKGVATAAGVFAGLSVALLAALLAVWLTVALVTRYSSVAALSAAVAAPAVMAWLLPEPAFLALALGMVALLFWRHRGNLRRLAAGEESKIKLRR